MADRRRVAAGRHSSLRITLETYVHWWPKRDRRRNIISSALRAAAADRGGTVASLIGL
jgi:hypothetical protein